MFCSLNLFQVVVLVLILVGVVMIFMRQNNTCVMKQNKVKEGFLTGNELGQLVSWANIRAPPHPNDAINRTCKIWNDEGRNLNPGQYCHVNCAIEGENVGKWKPGPPITLNKNGTFNIQGRDYAVKNLPSKKDYCRMVNIRL